MAIYPKPNHTFYGVLIDERKWPYQIYLCLEPNFSLSSFPSWSTWSIFWPPHHYECHHLAPHLVCTNLSQFHLEPKVSTLRFHQLSKTKLGLSSTQLKLPRTLTLSKWPAKGVYIVQNQPNSHWVKGLLQHNIGYSLELQNLTCCHTTHVMS
jgi:hypothetical protein